MLTVSALPGLNEQILEEIYMHVRGNAILPEKMVSRGYADMNLLNFTELHRTSLNLLWPKNYKNCKFSTLHGQICICSSYKSWEREVGCKLNIPWHYFSCSITIYSSKGEWWVFLHSKAWKSTKTQLFKQTLHTLMTTNEHVYV